MDECYRCGAETTLYSGGQPICMACDELREKEIAYARHLRLEDKKLEHPSRERYTQGDSHQTNS